MDGERESTPHKGNFLLPLTLRTRRRHHAWKEEEGGRERDGLMAARTIEYYYKKLGK